jgi:hypothetical protein
MSNLIPLRNAGFREKAWAKAIAEVAGEFDSEEELSDVLDTALYDPSRDEVIFLHQAMPFSISKVNRP